ncbi:monovalent cation/H+ antiporter complex subunit F [Lacticigenium naphthae]|uniref:monovalent cation/H+ antiporter complex subunit F n=1 Tax=Lacticigenium naphthae TaxID=515351 RepID=UPI00041FD608|nr:monovalent cation/H+ antiporter complex subunit F [Lacticigenium naphthae]
MSFNEIVLVVIGLLSVGELTRILIGPTVWDRMLGLNVLSSKVIIGAIFIGLLVEKNYMLDIALIFGLLGFIENVLFSQFIERKGNL